MDPLKNKFYEKSSKLSRELKTLMKEHGDQVVDNVTLSQVYGGMRDLKSMLWEPSALDPAEGIRFRGYTIAEIQEKLPKAPNGKEPLPEGLFYLMMVGEIPTEADVRWISQEWYNRGTLPEYVKATLDALPMDTHPMTQFCIGINAMQPESLFAKAYANGLSKTDYWSCTYEDSMNLIAKLPRLAAYIYRRVYHKGYHIEADPKLDWAANFAHMLGFEMPDFRSLMRLYLTVHADHEGGNASAHTAHLVGSTLSDVYLSYAAGMGALAGPLHGLANQEVIKWIFEMTDYLGTTRPSSEQIYEYVERTLAEGKVIPGYGHAVLRKPDPRFIAQKEFAERYIKNSDVIDVVWKCYEVVPKVLQSLGKVKNPWPNVDAHSGALLVHYGLTQHDFYTVLFGVSRALGVTAGLCWSRALGLPLERPKSVTSEWIKEVIAANSAPAS